VKIQPQWVVTPGKQNCNLTQADDLEFTAACPIISILEALYKKLSDSLTPVEN
jgi:hypothetical protein